jgi:hypothetical protein
LGLAICDSTPLHPFLSGPFFVGFSEVVVAQLFSIFLK